MHSRIGPYHASASAHPPQFGETVIAIFEPLGVYDGSTKDVAVERHLEFVADEVRAAAQNRGMSDVHIDDDGIGNDVPRYMKMGVAGFVPPDQVERVLSQLMADILHILEESRAKVVAVQSCT